MNTRHLKALELDKILLLCSQLAVSQCAKDKILEITPHTDYDSAVQDLQLTHVANDLSVRFGNPNFYTLSPITDIVGRANRSAQLSTTELLEAARLLTCTRELKNWYYSSADGATSLDDLFLSLVPNSHLEKEIKRCIVGENEIADNASSELSDIRRRINSANQRARENLEKVTKSSKYQKYLQEQIVTIRNGRFVVPVRSEHKNDVKGLVHDVSASGSTLFIEPMAVVELNNQIKELELDQQKEIDRILYTLSALVSEEKDNLLSNFDTIIMLDIIFAKSKLGDKMKAMPATLVRGEATILNSARHPLINRDDVVAIDIQIGDGVDTLVITGPNTGGKTVALKTVGLLTLMAHSGFMIPASSRSQVCFYRQILADIGDEQSIEQSLSTFSGHMTNIVNILKIADENSLILIDELGAGTDPVEGAALAVAIISTLRERGPHIVATTHYAEMKIYALQTEGVENASCEFDVVTLRPTYRLLMGTPGRSNAFAIGKRLGLSQDIISSAEVLISTENRRFEDVVSGLEETRQKLEAERRQAQTLLQQAASEKEQAVSQTKDIKSQQEKLLEDARRQARSILERVRFDAEHIMAELDGLKKQKDKQGYTATRGQIKGMIGSMEDIANPVMELSDEKYTLPRPLKKGDTVFLIDFRSEGVVLSTADNKGNIRVKAGIIDTRIPENRVRLVKKEKTTLNGGSVRATVSKGSGGGSDKLDLRGFDSHEAQLELRRFIDGAALRNLSTVIIVHGKGTGVLREMVTRELKNFQQVASYRIGGYGEGGSGVTIAELQ